jgi:Tfp pilus assembly protein PilF
MVVLAMLLASLAAAQSPVSATRSATSELIQPQGKVEVLRAGTPDWTAATTNTVLRPGDAVRTGPASRALVRLSNDSVVRLDERSILRLQPPRDPVRRSPLRLLSGMLYFFHRERPAETDFETPLVSGAIRGTEFTLAVAENGRTVLALLDGFVALTNEFGQLDLATGEQGIVEPGAAPAKTAALEANNVIQWCLYYPAVVDLSELKLSADEQQALSESLAAYRAGDLLQALARYPANRQPSSAGETLYSATLLLAVGQVEQAEQRLATLPPRTPQSSPASELADALRTLIAAVKNQNRPSTLKPDLATSLLAESYRQQAQLRLKEALASARAAVARSANFGLGWARIAELEFSFGHTRHAFDAIESALRLTPRNAQAHAVKGFLLAAQDKIPEAVTEFDEATAIDAALGNAWLGRGLCRIRRGQTDAGRDDLLVAAALEPNRALLRSYLGKAFSAVADDARAFNELALAQRLDPRDPTAWLYSALLNQQRNRINEAIHDLERSQELNDNRRLYRSRLLLDQDRAVRGANLANVYRDAGMFDVGVREAARAVHTDYANYSAHLFLAESYSGLAGPGIINLRYESVAFSELLLAQLLAPAGAGTLSRYVTQQEYSRLFERDGVGVSSATEYLSSGDWLEAGSQYGTFGKLSYSLDAVYHSQNGQRPNNALSQLTLAGTFKQQITTEDSVFLQAVFYDADAEDPRQYYDPSTANPTLRIKESQEPNLFLGWHHEWSPASHTLLLGSRLHDDFRLSDPRAEIQTVAKTNGVPAFVFPRFFGAFDLQERNQFVAYSAELQQIWQPPRQTWIAGARFQTGENDTDVSLPKLGASLATYPGAQTTATDLQRLSFYAYDNWQLIEPLRVMAGVSYDRLYYPRNIDLPPISAKQEDKDQVSPKVGLIWAPTKEFSARAAYTRSLGGLYFDNSVRLEPTQIAGFNQAYRSLIPESVGGLAAGTEFETWGVELEGRLATRTYLGLRGELLESRARRTLGVFDVDVFNNPNTATPSGTSERLIFRERSLTFSANQLLGDDWSLGLRYRLSEAELDDRLTEIPISIYPRARDENRAVLHQLLLFAHFNHPSGFFAQFQSLWTAQFNHNLGTDLKGDDFWQFNLLAGYRFARRRAEVALGLLNLTDQDYRLYPLNLYAELPRERTLLVRCRFNF